MDEADDTLASTLSIDERGPPAPRPGTVVGRYMLLAEVGAGGMGVVYAAFDPELDRKVAIKLLFAANRSDRLLLEARALARLSDPSVVAVHDVGEQDGRVFLAMEFVEGRTLAAWLAEHPRRWRDVARMFEAAARGLSAAHAKGIVHGDFKPQNVMVGDDGRVRVMDFGLAREHAIEPLALTRDAPLPGSREELGRRTLDDLSSTNQMLGTPGYMAPELYRGEVANARSDQFAFCVALYEGLYGERPFAGETVAALALAIVHGEVRPAPPKSRVPGWMRAVVVRGMSRDPARRFDSMDDLLAALRADPTRRRRRIGGTVVVLGALASVLAWQRIEAARAHAHCEALGAAITEVWNDDVASELARSFQGSGLVYAPDTWARARPWLDAYADAWGGVRTAHCHAAASVPAHTRERIESCLDERRDAFATAIDVLRSADANAVRNAVTVAAGLMPIDVCTDEGWLARRIDPPSDEATRAKVIEARRAMRRARALHDAGRANDALEAAREALALAEAANWDLVRGEASLLLGRCETDRGEHAAAIEHFRAAFVAAGIAGDDERVADASNFLAIAVGNRMSRVEEGQVWAELSAVATARAGQLDQLPGAELEHTRALLSSARGDYAEARRAHERALAIWERVLGRDHPAVAISLVNLVNIYRLLGELDAALAAGARALAIQEQRLGVDHPDVVSTLINTGAVLLTMGRADDALPMFERALAIQERAVGPDNTTVAVVLTNLGLLRLGRGEVDRARADLERALAIQQRVLGEEHPKLAAILVNLGGAYLLDGDNATARSMFARAVALRERALGPDHPDLVGPLGELCEVDIVLHELPRAREACERGLAIATKAFGPDHREVADLRGSLGRVLLDMGDSAAAREHLEHAVKIREQTPGDPGVLARNRFALARVLATLGDDRTRAHELAQAARTAFALDPLHDHYVRDIDGWLAASSR